MTDESGRFSKYPATSMVSIFENTNSKITIHLIHDSTLTESNREKLIDLVSMYDQSIQFYNLDEIFPERIANLKSKYDEISNLYHWAFGAMYRLLAPELIDASKIIYFDTDIIVNLDIEELWNIDLKNFPIAAKPEIDAIPNIEAIPDEIDIFKTNPKKICDVLNLVKHENYFGSAVLVMNLDLIRQIFSEENTTLIDVSFAILQKYPLEYPDQDALNFLFSESYLHLPAKYNVFVWQINNYLIMKNRPPCLNRWIYHFSGYNQKFDSEHEFSRIWFNYFCKTPFCNAETFFNIAKDFQLQLDEERLKIQKIIALSHRKHFAGFVFESDISKLKQFHFQDLIFAENNIQQNLQRIVDFLQRDPGKNFLMIFIAGFQEIAEILSQIGLEENEDFCDGLQFLTHDQIGVFKNERHIVFYM